MHTYSISSLWCSYGALVNKDCYTLEQTRAISLLHTYVPSRYGVYVSGVYVSGVYDTSMTPDTSCFYVSACANTSDIIATYICTIKVWCIYIHMYHQGIYIHMYIHVPSYTYICTIKVWCHGCMDICTRV